MNLYTNTYRYYDIIKTDFNNNDLLFYRNFLNTRKCNVLELCCGTGRVSIYLASQGYNVTAMDLSKEMLDVFREKIKSQEAIQSRIRILHGDISDFSINGTFSLIIAPSKSFQAITDLERARTALKSIKKHMSEKSVLVLDMNSPKILIRQSSVIGEDLIIYQQNNITAYYKCISIDYKKHISKTMITIEESVNNEAVKRFVDFQELRYYSIEEITGLLSDAGLKVFEIYNRFSSLSIEPSLSDDYQIAARLA